MYSYLKPVGSLVDLRVVLDKNRGMSRLVFLSADPKISLDDFEAYLMFINTTSRPSFIEKILIKPSCGVILGYDFINMKVNIRFFHNNKINTASFVNLIHLDGSLTYYRFASCFDYE